MADPILSLDPIERRVINIDGKPFEVFSPEELSVAECQWFTRQGEKIKDLSAASDDSADEDLEAAVSAFAKRVFVDLPAAAFNKLTGYQKMRIVASFTVLLLGNSMNSVGAMMQGVNALGGAKPSSDSSASTAAIPRGGSKKRKSGT